MVLILIGAAVFSAMLQEWTEAIVILTIVIINAVIGIVQERKAESSLEALKQMSAPNARVLRQGEESIVPASELVVGDIVLIDDGAMVPADLRLIESANFKNTGGLLTYGRIRPVGKGRQGDHAVRVCAGRPGEHGVHLVYRYLRTRNRRGGGNRHGYRGRQYRRTFRRTRMSWTPPLKRKLNAVGKTLTVVGIIVCALIFAIGAFYGRPLIPQFLVAISLAISIIPEGLPATATIVMALGVQRMAKAERLNPEAAGGGDIGQRHGNLQRQDRNSDLKPDDRHPDCGERGF